MRRITLSGTDVSTSRFIFGTASLFNIGTATAQRGLVDQAVDHGFTHFDTAPLYGFGHAERALAPMLRRRPDVTVTTKIGLYAPGGENQTAASVFLRKAGGRLVPSLSRAIADWRVESARNSLSGSLTRLGRSRIDLYMLHEPDAELITTDEWQRWLEQERQSGRIAAFGIAADAERAAQMLLRGAAFCNVIQTIDSFEGREADQLAAAGRPMQITYGYISAASRRGAFDGSRVMRAAMRRNPGGAIIVSTSRPERLGFYRDLATEEAT